MHSLIRVLLAVLALALAPSLSVWFGAGHGAAMHPQAAVDHGSPASAEHLGAHHPAPADHRPANDAAGASLLAGFCCGGAFCAPAILAAGPVEACAKPTVAPTASVARRWFGTPIEPEGPPPRLHT